MAFSRPVNPSSFAHLARSFFTSPQVRISMYSSDSVPITLAVRGPASFGASVSLSHSNSVMAVWMAMARSEPGSAELSTTRKGFPNSLSSVITRSSASR